MSSLLTSALGDAAAILSRMGEALKALLESVDDSTFTTMQNLILVANKVHNTHHVLPPSLGLGSPDS